MNHWLIISNKTSMNESSFLQYLPTFLPVQQSRAAVEPDLSLSQDTPVSWYTYQIAIQTKTHGDASIQLQFWNFCLLIKYHITHTPLHHTLYNVMLRIARNFLESRENIKIFTHPLYHVNLGWFSWEWSKFFFFFSKKKFKMANSKNWDF